MRTLAGTFGTRDEAEVASRRLQAIGIPGERIIMKDVAPTAEAGSGAGGAFISVKVTTEQVEPVGEILKGRWTGTAASDPASFQPAARIEAAPRMDTAPRRGTTEAAAPAPPPIAKAAELAARAANVAPPPHSAASPAAREREKARLGRNLVLFGLALVAAFMIGAWLGLLSE
jgi:hypothetical protein